MELDGKPVVVIHVATHGRITRSQVAGLCRLSDDQATRLLARMVKEGTLDRSGVRKFAVYTRRV